MTFKQITQEIEKNKFAPVYHLYGEEPWFIDQIVNLLDEKVVSKGQAAFNRSVFYGADAKAGKVINACKSFPVMAKHRIVFLKEAQKMHKKSLELIVKYVNRPVPTTVFVMTFKGKNAKLPKGGIKGAKKHGVDFFSKRMYEKDVIRWTEAFIREEGYTIANNIPGILVSNLGTDIGLISNELQKIFIYLKATQQKQLKADTLYEMINLDKKFNVFELIKALSKKEVYQCHLIMDRLTQNEKLTPPILTINSLFRFFHNLAMIFSLRISDPNDIKSALKMNWYAAQDYATARTNFSRQIVYRNLGHILDADLMLKGIIPTQMGSAHILKTLMWQLLN